ncbi:hypothetical protein [Streptomyces sp. NPDC006971]|uniref:hypothetical protein n=1 Tax=Streptomyces sp. NPDC006971 TaxID=3154784 RepID=UPI00340725A4
MPPRELRPESEGLFEQYSGRALTQVGTEPLRAPPAADTPRYQQLPFKARASSSAHATDQQMVTAEAVGHH